jgi:hypothetical protein
MGVSMKRLMLLAAAGFALTGAAQGADFNAGAAKDVLGIVTTHGASAEIKSNTDGKPYIDGQAGRLRFQVYFNECDDKGGACGSLMFNGSWDSKKITVDQLNRWNRWTLYCPAYLDTDGTPDIWYSVAVSERTSSDDVAADLDRWMGCLQDFDDLVDSPEEFLSHHQSGGGETDAPAPSGSAPPAAAPAHPGAHTSAS